MHHMHEHEQKQMHECPDASPLDGPGNKAVNVDRSGTRKGSGSPRKQAAQAKQHPPSTQQAALSKQQATRSTGKKATGL
jgi:hypothetical protein